MTVPSVPNVPVVPIRSTAPSSTVYRQQVETYHNSLNPMSLGLNTAITAFNIDFGIVNANAAAVAASTETVEGIYDAILAGGGYGAAVGTSNSNVTVGTGPKVFNASTGKIWWKGQNLYLRSAADPTKYIVGAVTGYNIATGLLNLEAFTFDGAGSANDWEIYPGGPRGSRANIQEFSASGNWLKPSEASFVMVDGVGAGGGGGSGAVAAISTSNPGGGGGGGGGAPPPKFIRASDLSTTETVVIGAAGVGGASTTTDSTQGVLGGNGGNTTFGGNKYIAYGGTGGNPGVASTLSVLGGNGGNATSFTTNISGSPFMGGRVTGGTRYSFYGGGKGGDGSYNPGEDGFGSFFGGPGGGGGGGHTNANVPSAGRTGGSQGAEQGGGATGGAAGTNVAQTGQNGSNGAAYQGGGGGGSAFPDTNLGRNGGDGGNGGRGSGGGGGGAGVNGGTSRKSGKGGDGGPGFLRVITWS